MKILQNLKSVVGGFEEYAITPDTYDMAIELANLYLEESNFFEVSEKTNANWPYTPIYFEVRGDKNFGNPEVDFTLNVGIKLRKLED